MKAGRRKTVALVPVKGFANAKRRLAAVLAPAERGSLARAMLRDVLAAIAGCDTIDRTVLLGGGDARDMAADAGLDWLDDHGEAELNRALSRAAGELAAAGAGTVFVLPGDLPTVQSADLGALLACHEAGLTLSPARSDGGTNALILSPPDSMDFRFGTDSARRHLAAARAARLPAQDVPLDGFARDIDRVADLHWLCRQPCGRHTQAWLADHDMERRLNDPGQTALQA